MIPAVSFASKREGSQLLLLALALTVNERYRVRYLPDYGLFGSSKSLPSAAGERLTRPKTGTAEIREVLRGS